MRSDAQRIAQYISKVVPTTVGLKVAEQLSGMKSSFTSWTNYIVPLETQVQSILNALGTCVAEYPFYYAFMREIASDKSRGIDGPALVSFATVAHAKYVSYGYTTATLKKIATDVFGITIP